MNPGGDPGRDDYGLPPAGIEIPDDARELDRDVQAYYRELRAQRRRMFLRRLVSPLTRDGMVMPVLAGCLALTLLAGTLLTVFTVSPIPPAPTQSTVWPSHRASTGGAAPQLLPDAIVLVGGQQRRLRDLAGTVLLLALIPHACRCLPDVRLLKVAAVRASARIYLVGAPGVPVAYLSRRVGLGPAHAVEDYQDQLPAAYRPAALTAVVVSTNGSVTRVRDPAHGPALAAALRTAAHRPQKPPGPGGTVPSSAAAGG